jgi:hypothetical protein
MPRRLRVVLPRKKEEKGSGSILLDLAKDSSTDE